MELLRRMANSLRIRRLSETLPSAGLMDSSGWLSRSVGLGKSVVYSVGDDLVLEKLSLRSIGSRSIVIINFGIQHEFQS